jgi:hypothetical protein
MDNIHNNKLVYDNIASLETFKLSSVTYYFHLNALSYVKSSEELHNFYSSPDIIRQIKQRRMRWAGHVARMGEEIKVYKVLVGNPEGMRPLGRPRLRWEDEIRMDVGEICLGVWI